MMQQNRKIVAIALTAGFIVTPSPGTSIEPTTVAAVATGLSHVVSMFDKGANPEALQIAQSHQMLKLMHERLANFTQAFDRIYQKINEMPEVVRRELNYSRNAANRQQMLGYIERMSITFGLLAKGSHPGLLSPESRLNKLEEYSNRVRTSTEDLNLPHMLMSMQMEKAIYYGFDLEESWEGTNDTPGIKSLYRDRIEQMLDSGRNGSLVSSKINLDTGIEHRKVELEAGLKNLNISYVYQNVVNKGYNACDELIEWYPVDIALTLAQVEKTVKKRIADDELIVMLQIADIYRVLVREAEYAVAAIYAVPAQARPVRFSPRKFGNDWSVLPETKPIFERVLAYHDMKLREYSLNLGPSLQLPAYCRDGRVVNQLG